MKRNRVRLAALLLALLLVAGLAPPKGRAVLSGVYFTAVNEQLLELSSDTMPFLSGGVWYVPSRIFVGTDLGVNYVPNYTLGLEILYTNKTDLRFNMEGQYAFDRSGNTYNEYAIERGGVVFFPLPLVCRRFDLRWSITETDTVPLIRVKSASAILDDRDFIDAAAGQMSSRYAEYEKAVTSTGEGLPPTVDQPVQAAEGQKVYLVVDGQPDTLSVLAQLGSYQATFLLTVDEMEDGDLLRALVAGGHGVALEALGETDSELEYEVEQARALLWQATCSWLELLWCANRTDPGPVLDRLGCEEVSADLSARDGLAEPIQAAVLMRSIGRYREDVSVFLGSGRARLGGLPTLLEALAEGGYRVCAWRIGGRQAAG